jgi:hypothetical protein
VLKSCLSFVYECVDTHVDQFKFFTEKYLNKTYFLVTVSNIEDLHKIIKYGILSLKSSADNQLLSKKFREQNDNTTPHKSKLKLFFKLQNTKHLFASAYISYDYFYQSGKSKIFPLWTDQYFDNA